MIALKRRLEFLLYYLRNAHYRKLKKSGLFNASFYLSQYQVIDSIDLNIDSIQNDPLIHYIKFGWLKKRNPNPLFEAAWYSQQYTLSNEQEPLLHYIEQGMKRGNNPSPLFFTSYYIEQYPQSAANGQNPLRHYLIKGCHEGKNPNPLFDTAWYLERNPEVTQLGQNPLYHYYHIGGHKQRNPMPFFDSRYYCERNPVVLSEWLYPQLHFWEKGDEEAQTPNPIFDPTFYQGKYGLNKLSPVALFLHYAQEGCLLNYQPSSLFDAKFYAKTYPESLINHDHPLEHYLEKGIVAAHYPCQEIAELPSKPTISILTPVYNTVEEFLRRCIHSVLYQAYPHWELCLVDDGSSAEHIRSILEEYAARETRIKIRFLTKNQGISLATNQAAELASGEYLAFLDHDDELTQDALYHMASAINKIEPDALYSDEDLIDWRGQWCSGFYKPDYNSELLLCHNYITHFFVTRSELFHAVGGLSADCTGAQDYDLLLKITDQTDNIHHIRRSLYRWRATETSTSLNHEQKDYADAAGMKALQKMVQRRGIQAEVKPGQGKFFYQLRRKVAGDCHVNVLIYLDKTGTQAMEWLEKLISNTHYKLIDFHILHEQGMPLPLPGGLNERVHMVELASTETQATALNRIVSKMVGEHLVFLRQGLLPQKMDWISVLLSYSQSEKCGVVGGRIASGEDEHIENLAIPDLTDLSCDAFRAVLTESSFHLNGINCPQNVIARSFAYCMVKRNLFEQVKGFDVVNFPTFLYDIDLCLRLRKLGFEHVFTPFCNALAFTKDDQNEIPVENWLVEKAVFQEKWQSELKYNPYYNENRLLEESGVSRQAWLHYMTGVEG